jgi:hypothetical protein
MDEMNDLPSADRSWWQQLLARGFASPEDRLQDVIVLQDHRPASSDRKQIAIFLPTMLARFDLAGVGEFLDEIGREIRFAIEEADVDIHLYIAMQYGGGSEVKGRAAVEMMLQTLAQSLRGTPARVGMVALLLPGPGKIVSINAMTALASDRKVEAVVLIDDDVAFSAKCFSRLIQAYLASPAPVAIGARKIGQPFATSSSQILSRMKTFTQPAVNYPHACCMIVSIEVIAPEIPLIYSSDDGYVCFRLLQPWSAEPLERLRLLDHAYCYHQVGGRDAGEIFSRIRRMLLHHHLFLSHADRQSTGYYLSQLLFFGMWPLVPFDRANGWGRGIIKCLLKYAYAIWFGKIAIELIVRGFSNRPLSEISWGGMGSASKDPA